MFVAKSDNIEFIHVANSVPQNYATHRNVVILIRNSACEYLRGRFRTRLHRAKDRNPVERRFSELPKRAGYSPSQRSAAAPMSATKSTQLCVVRQHDTATFRYSMRRPNCTRLRCRPFALSSSQTHARNYYSIISKYASNA